jgi:hypothetical protein
MMHVPLDLHTLQNQAGVSAVSTAMPEKQLPAETTEEEALQD